MPQELTSVDDISTRLGSYGLLIELSKDFSLSRPRFYGAVLKKGQYLYAGSAFGPGGIRGRVRYHLNQPKPAHWHVDDLTNVGLVQAIFIFPGVKECKVIKRFQRVTEIQTPIPGFGSSDCATCEAHLVQLSRLTVGNSALKSLKTTSVWTNQKGK